MVKTRTSTVLYVVTAAGLALGAACSSSSGPVYP